MRSGNHRHGRRRGSDGRAGSRANRTKVRGRSGSRDIRAEVELRSQEDNPEEQGYNTDTVCRATHVLIKTKLKKEWLQSQVKYRQGVLTLRTPCRRGGRGWLGATEKDL